MGNMGYSKILVTLPLLASACSSASVNAAIQSVKPYINTGNCLACFSAIGVYMAIDAAVHGFHIEDMYVWKVFDLFDRR